MGYYTEISNSEYAAKDTALINRMQGNDSHSIVGAALATNAGNILNLGMSIFGKITAKSEAPEETNPETVEEKKSNLTEFNDLRRKFLANPTKANAQALQEFYEDNSANNTIYKGYNNIRKDVETALKKTA